MARLSAQILFFPLAALALGVTYQTLHPEGVWSLPDRGVAAAGGVPRVEWAEAAPRTVSGEWLLVDARESEQFTAGHIPGAVSLPANSYEEALLFFAEEHGREKTVVVYCGSEDCDLSAELAARLQAEAGFTDVRILRGGILAWRRQP